MLLLKDYIHSKNLTLKGFLYQFLVNLNNIFDTVYANNPDCIQCDRGRSRSLWDITSICLSYYPDTSMKEVKETLLSFNEKLVGHYCHDINKRV